MRTEAYGENRVRPKIVPDTMTNDKSTLSQLETFLFGAADILRGKICAKASLEFKSVALSS